MCLHLDMKEHFLVVQSQKKKISGVTHTDCRSTKANNKTDKWVNTHSGNKRPHSHCSTQWLFFPHSLFFVIHNSNIMQK